MYEPVLQSRFFFFFACPMGTASSTLSLHDALPISARRCWRWWPRPCSAPARRCGSSARSEEHTSELQSPCNLVCRLLLEKKKISKTKKFLNKLLHSLNCITSNTNIYSVV